MSHESESERPDWFANWFGSPYYARLYARRDEREAAAFLDHLVQELQPVLKLWPSPVKVLDLACGTGRHAIHLSRKGFDVTGIDLSAENIAAAHAHANDRLRFEVADMRGIEYENEFHWSLNLFTSFGYFADEDEHEAVLRNVYHALTANGLLVIDFLNADYVRHTLVQEEELELNGTRYHILRRIQDGCVHKVINVYDGDRYYPFDEWVRLFSVDDFDRLLTENGFEVFGLWGDYAGSPYLRDRSERLIVFARARK